MPIISRFYGITIKMYFQQREHNPPHIHAVYGEYIGAIDIKTGKLLEGDLPKKPYYLYKNGLLIIKMIYLIYGIHNTLSNSHH